MYIHPHSHMHGKLNVNSQLLLDLSMKINFPFLEFDHVVT